MPEPIERSSLADMAVDAVLQHIEREGLRDGDALPATGELAESLGVSRPVVREALATLAGLGLLRRHQGRESVVTTPGSAQLERLLRLRFQLLDSPYEDIQEFRELVEVGAARLAARHATPEDIERLRACVDRLRASSSETELHDADVEFHRTLAVAGDNDLMAMMIESITPLLRQLRIKVWEGWVAAGGGRDEIIEAHVKVLDAVEARDEAAAAAAMTHHMSQARAGLDGGARV